MDIIVTANAKMPNANEQIAHPYHHGDLRNALLIAARAMLEEGPLTALSLRAVARRAGVSHAAPYRHFANQEAMLVEVAREGFVELRHQVEAVDASGTLTERIAGLSQTYMGFVARHPALVRLMFGPQIADRNRHSDFGEAADGVGEAIGILLNDTTFGLAVWAALHGLAAMVLENVIELGQSRFGLDVLAPRAEDILERLICTRTV
jgi:AcrR family transcriptional regulator